jgi:hypothetical protein
VEWGAGFRLRFESEMILFVVVRPGSEEELTQRDSAQHAIGFPEEKERNEHEKQHHHPRFLSGICSSLVTKSLYKMLHMVLHLVKV